MEPTFNHAGLAQIWLEGDAVIKAVAVVLLIMSLITWVIFLWKLLDQRAHRRQANGCEGFWHSADFAQGMDKLGDAQNNPFRAVAMEGREAQRHILHKDGRNSPQLHDSLEGIGNPTA